MPWLLSSCLLVVLSALRRRRLNNNSLSGPFPASLAKIPQLSFL